MNEVFQKLLSSFGLLLTGMGMVMCLLFALYGMCYGVGLLFKRHAAKAKAPVDAHPEGNPSLFAGAKATASADDENIPLVIATAIYRLMEAQNYRVLTVKTVNPAATAWAQEGRRAIFISRHQL